MDSDGRRDRIESGGLRGLDFYDRRECAQSGICSVKPVKHRRELVISGRWGIDVGWLIGKVSRAAYDAPGESRRSRARG